MAGEAATNGKAPEPRLARYLKEAAAVVGGLAALAGAVYGLIQVFTDGGDGGGGSIAEIATVSVGKPQVQGSAAVFDTDVEVSGERGRRIRVLWTLMDVERGGPVTEPGFAKQPVATFKPGEDKVKRSFQVTVPVPNTTDLVFLRIEVLDEGDERLAFADSERLRLGGFSP